MVQAIDLIASEKSKIFQKFQKNQQRKCYA